MARRAVAIVLVACGRVGFDATGQIGQDGGVDTTDGSRPCTAFGPWAAPQLVANVNSMGEETLGPALSPDNLDLYFHSSRASSSMDLFVAHRATRESAFGPPQLIVSLMTNGDERDPSIAHGGDHFYFSSNRGGALVDTLYLAVGAGTTFGPAIQLTELGIDTYGPWVSDNELELVFSMGSALLRSTRPDTASMWSTPTPISELGGMGGYPSITGDGLEIFLEPPLGGEGVFTATRPGIGMPFSPPIELPQLGAAWLGGPADPFVSLDGVELFLGGDLDGSGRNDLYVSTRACL